MAIETVREYLSKFGVGEKILEFGVSSATVELAAIALCVEPARIAKTLSFKKDNHAILVVTSGDTKIDNGKFKLEFGLKAKMLTADEVVELVGHAVGGVCPFGVASTVEVYLDESLHRFDTVFPACGSSNSAIELTCDELATYSKAVRWVDVCKNFE